MRRFVNPGKRIASFTRTFARMRWALNFDGVGIRGTLAQRMINVDLDNSFEFYTGDADKGGQVIVSQNITGTFELQEFRMFTSTFIPMQFQLIIGGVSNFLGTVDPNTKYGLDLIGLTYVLKNAAGTTIRTGPITKGSAREPTAVTKIGCSTDGAGNFNFFKGIQRDIKINGTLWPIADRNQAIQLPEPSGLGAELITQSVLENPSIKGTQWTYLGDGRWQLVGDGNLSELKFILEAGQPPQGFLQFEIESVSGSLSCNNENSSAALFNSIGVKRYFYVSKTGGVANGQCVNFKRATPGQSVACIIKNISFKPLGSCNPMTVANATSANWVEVPV